MCSSGNHATLFVKPSHTAPVIYPTRLCCACKGTWQWHIDISRSQAYQYRMYTSSGLRSHTCALPARPRLQLLLGCQSILQACICAPVQHVQQKTLHVQPTAAVPSQQPDRVDIRVASLSDQTDSFIAAAQRPTAFKRYGITGDGSCMFRACVQGHYQLQHGGALLESQQEYRKALELRRSVVNELRSSREEMEPFLPGIADDFDDYLRQMSKPGVWGGEPELLMASRVLKRPISVYEATWSGPQYLLTYGEDLLKTAAPMHLLWSGAHYDLLVPQITSKL